MCTVIAKESQTRVIVLKGLQCCLSVEEIEEYIPKVSRANGWFELYVGHLCAKTPKWATWLPAQALDRVMETIPHTHNGKPIWYYDVSDRVPDDLASKWRE